ncbi:alpha/beta hydrolase [Micromonospora sp. NBC_01655]|uniref:esterase/lipase family protein n=1 Tax=Micromonospora sp. NBC_01655 TaxID=2975983 RepID=UPI002256CEB7|nr:hypothetical protein [Micromonospora sp. NBC_01655]MCX4471759.1 alpha/beta hydrolase [Micromonospora sp. NBC_01655]
MSDAHIGPQVSVALRANRPVILAAGPREVKVDPLAPNEVWDLPGGTAWVYFATGNDVLTRPVILADGFNSGPSTLEFSWAYLESGDYALISALRDSGRDVVLLGFQERSASILDNAEAATAAVLRAVAQRRGDAPLAVGGFSMGGLVTRYALAKLESEGIDHETALYWSYDSPHRGASVPVALQAFAHYIRDLDSRFSDQMNSPAARELLAWHIAEWNDQPAISQDRRDFLLALDEVGGWPRRPRRIGVANGVGTGVGNGNAAGALAVQGLGLAIVGTRLNVQPAGDDQLVAALRVVTTHTRQVHTSGLPTVGSAPGGTLDGFGILADTLNALPTYLGMRAQAHIRSHCFVPAVSAVAIRDVDTEEALYTPVDTLDPGESELDEFRVASRNEEHTLITEELCSWLIERLP